MLLLTRRVNESIHIGDDIVVTVKRIQRGHVKISIAAPKEIRILRSELLEAREEKHKDENIT